MDSDVIVPELASFDIEAEKDEQVSENEGLQKLFEKQIHTESNSTLFPAIRKHFEELIEQYGDIRTLADLEIPGEQLVIALKTKAAVVYELKNFLQMIDQVNETVEEDARE
jgi:hypothetical protein